MTEEFKKQIEMQARQAVTELLAEAKLKKGDVFVVGCSSSEIVGGHIGKDSSLEAAQAVYAGVAPVLAENGIWLAAQCCEHLNRAIIIEREAAEKYGWEEVCVVPRPHAGGTATRFRCIPMRVPPISMPAWARISSTATGSSYGFVPTTGMGMGMDRLAKLLTGAATLRDVILFPTLKKAK